MSENADIFKQVFDDLKRKDNLLSSPLGLLDLFLRQNKLGNDVEKFFGEQPSRSVLEPMIEKLEPLHQGQDMPPDYRLLEQVDNFLSVLRKDNKLDELNKKELFDLLDKLIQRFNAIEEMTSLKFVAENPCGKRLVETKMNQIFSRVMELSDQTFKALGKEDLKTCNALAILIELYKVFNKYPERFVKTFGSVSVYEKSICCDEDLLQFCEQIDSLPAETEKELVCHIRDNLFLKGCTLSLETLFALNYLLKDDIFCDGSQFSKIMQEKNINWLEKIDVYDWIKTEKYNASKLIEFMGRNYSKSAFVDKFIGLVKDKCDFSAIFSKEYFDINELKTNNMKKSKINSMIRALYMCFKYDKNKQDAINTIGDIFEHAPEGFLSVKQILALLDICNEFDVNIAITKDMFDRLFKCLERQRGQIKLHDLLLICGFCEDGAISGGLARRIVSLVEPRSNNNGFKMSISPEVGSDRKSVPLTRLDGFGSYGRTQFSRLTVNLFELMKSKFEPGFVFMNDMSPREHADYADLSTVFLLYCFESHVRVKHTRKMAIDFFRIYEYSDELVWTKWANESRNLKQYFKDRFWYYPRFNFGKVYQKFDGFAKEISLSNEELSVEDLMFLVFSDFRFSENGYMTEQEFRQRIPDEIDNTRYLLWLFRVYREQGIMTKDVFKLYINRYKIDSLKKLDMCFSVLLDSLIDHDVELLNLILDSCEISLSDEDRRSWKFKDVEENFLQLNNEGLTSRFYEKMNIARVNEKNSNENGDTIDNALPLTRVHNASESLGVQNNSYINSNEDSGATCYNLLPAYIQNESCELRSLDLRNSLKNIDVSSILSANRMIMTKTDKKYAESVNNKRSMSKENMIKMLLGFGVIASIIGIVMISAFFIFPEFAFLLSEGLINFGLGVISGGIGIFCFKQYVENFGGYDIKNCNWCNCFSIFKSKSIFRENAIAPGQPVFPQTRQGNGTDKSKNK